MPDNYTVEMRGEKFLLTRDQVEFDSPNYFTSCFLGEFTEAQTRTLTLSRDPELFKIILNYLSGYDVLPLHELMIPKQMNSNAALRNLLADAQFYQLDGLVDQIDEENQAVKKAEQAPASTSTYVMVVARWSQGVPPGPTISWNPAVPLSEEAVARIRQTQEFNLALMGAFQRLRPDIHKALEEAGFPTSYLQVEAAWAEENTGGGFTSSFAMKLV
ncbi:hypothetical protein FRC12_012042 [Ceratobasidium sp. 428]|nr:hypothetical protein FRC12_012042 [Ceratobasidium sp. 428]